MQIKPINKSTYPDSFPLQVGWHVKVMYAKLECPLCKGEAHIYEIPVKTSDEKNFYCRCSACGYTGRRAYYPSSACGFFVHLADIK